MPIAGTVVAPISKRVVAYVIDLVAVVLLGGGFVAAGVWQWARGADGGRVPVLAIVGAGVLLVFLVLQWWLVGSRGVTLGKRLVGLRVVDADSGERIGPARALGRAALVLGSGLVPIIGPAMVLGSPLLDRSVRRQGWHDRASRAVVLDVGLGLDPVDLPSSGAVHRRLDDLLAPRGGATGTAPAAGIDRFGRWPEESVAVPAVSAVDGAATAAAVRPRRNAFLPDSTTNPGPQPAPVAPPHVVRPTVVMDDRVAVPAPVSDDVIATVPIGGQDAPSARHVRRDDEAPSPRRGDDYAPPPARGGDDGVPSAGRGGGDGVPSREPSAAPAAPAPADPAPAPAATPVRRVVPVRPVVPAPAVPAVPEVPAARAEPAEPTERAVPPDQPDLADDVDRTRLRPARGKVPEVGTPAAEVTLVLTDGRRVRLAGTALIGRDPTARANEEVDQLVAVADPGRSVSKTHLAVGADRSGVWVRDRGSTNGTVVTLTDGQQILCGPDQQVRLPAGASVAFGDYGFTVAGD